MSKIIKYSYYDGHYYPSGLTEDEIEALLSEELEKSDKMTEWEDI